MPWSGRRCKGSRGTERENSIVQDQRFTFAEGRVTSHNAVLFAWSPTFMEEGKFSHLHQEFIADSFVIHRN